MHADLLLSPLFSLRIWEKSIKKMEKVYILSITYNEGLHDAGPRYSSAEGFTCQKGEQPLVYSTFQRALGWCTDCVQCVSRQGCSSASLCQTEVQRCLSWLHFLFDQAVSGILTDLFWGQMHPSLCNFIFPVPISYSGLLSNLSELYSALSCLTHF